MKRIIGMTAAATALGLALTGTAPAWAVGGSFYCEKQPLFEVQEHVEGSYGLIRIINQYVLRWDAEEAMKQCRAYAKGQPYDISCLSDRRDWNTILSSVPKEYFGQSTASLSKYVKEETRKGNNFNETMKYCRSVGAIE